MTNPRDDLADGIHDAFRAHNPTLYAAIVALLDAGADPGHVTRYIDRECRRTRGHGPGTTENAAAVTIEVLVRRRAEYDKYADPFGGSVLDDEPCERAEGEPPPVNLWPDQFGDD